MTSDLKLSLILILVIELHSVQQSLRLNHQSTTEIINQTPRVPPLNGQPGNELIITEPKNVFRPPLPSNESVSPPVPTVPLSTDSSCSENIIAKDKMRLQEKDDRSRLRIDGISP